MAFAGVVPAEEEKQPYRIGVCDWMILKRQKLGAFQLTKEIGADGVEVDMGSLGDRETFDNQLAKPEVRQQFLDKAKELNVQICSIAMSGFYAQSFAERATALRIVEDCIDTMKQMNVKIAFLPLGVKGDLVKRPELRPAIIERLKAIAPKAESAGVTIGIETALDAAGEMRLLKDVGSPAIRIYFNFANPLQAGRDLYAELRTLGKERILELYLNTVDWGPGLCGARTASRTYFGKAPAKLSTLESAWLAASLRQPQRAYEREFLTGRADLVRTHGVLAQMRSVPSSERARSARQSLAFASAPRRTPIAASAAATR